MRKKLNIIAAVILTMLAVIGAPTNVFAMTDAGNSIMPYNYDYSGSCTKDFSITVTATGVYNVPVIVKGSVTLTYEWDEGYASTFRGGSGSAYVSAVPDNISKDGWTATVNVARNTGSNIVFNVVVYKDGSAVGSAEISYHVDEYGQVS